MSLLVGQIPGADQALESAAHTGSWVVVLFVTIVLSMVAGFVLLFRVIMNQHNQRMSEAKEREDRYAEQVKSLDDTQRGQMVELIKDNASCVAKVDSTLSNFCARQGDINGDLKKLCSLLSTTPCLFVARGRGRYRVVDEQGDEVDTNREHREGD